MFIIHRIIIRIFYNKSIEIFELIKNFMIPWNAKNSVPLFSHLQAKINQNHWSSSKADKILENMFLNETIW